MLSGGCAPESVNTPQFAEELRAFGPDLRKYKDSTGNSVPKSRTEGFVIFTKPKPNLNHWEITPTWRATQRPVCERRAS